MPTTPQVRQFLCDVRAVLMALADPARAAAMSAYMRNQFEYLGVGTPEHRAAAAPLIRAFGPTDAEELRKAVEGLWAMREREYQYVALGLLARYQKILSLDDLPWLLELVQQRPWWDTVDSLVKTVGAIVRRSGAKGAKAMHRALRSKSLWVRRIAMLHQLGWRGETNTERLFLYAERLAEEKEFFIRKAIGWALRDYAWHDWRAVEKFLKTTQVEFAGLTVREARKNFETLKKQRVGKIAMSDSG
jgi:3-methyladenine DNA glycosylase AlkD